MHRMLLPTLLAVVCFGLAPSAAADPICGDTVDFGMVAHCLQDADRLARQHGVTLVGKVCDVASAC